MLAGSSVPSLCNVEGLTLDGGLALGLVSDGVDVSIGGQALTAEFEMIWSLYPRLSTLDGCLSLDYGSEVSMGKQASLHRLV